MANAIKKIGGVFRNNHQLSDDSLLTDANLWSYWKLEGNATDETSGDADGTATNITWGTSYGKFGQGASFNGSSSKIAQSSGTKTNVSGDISISLWAKFNTLAGYQNLIHKDNQYTITVDPSGNISWADSSNWSYANFGYHKIGLNTTDWHHIVVTKTGGTVNIYRNGNFVVNKTAFGSSLATTTSWMHFGCYSNASTCSSNYFNGYLDDVSVFNRALTYAEVKSLYEQRTKKIAKVPHTPPSLYDSYLYNDANLVAYYRHEGNANDSKGSYNGNATNVTFSSDYGIFGQRGDYNGTSSKIVIPDNSALKPTGAFSISAWIKAKANTRGIFGSYTNDTGSNYRGILLYQNDYLVQLFIGEGSTNYNAVNSTTSIAYNSWTHVVGTWDTSNMRMYINGALNCTPVAQTDAPAYNATNSVGIGFWKQAGTDSYFFQGFIDDISLWSKALSATEISNLYNTNVKKLGGIANT